MDKSVENILKQKANWLRGQVLEIVFKTGKGHLGGTFSCIDNFEEIILDSFWTILLPGREYRKKPASNINTTAKATSNNINSWRSKENLLLLVNNTML